MSEHVVVACGGTPSPTPPSVVGTGSRWRALSLDLHGSRQNVALQVGAITKAMAANLPDVLVDLLEIAAYVFAADQAIARGEATNDGQSWRRRFEFQIPVRTPERWSEPDVKEALIQVLSFLSDDEYTFRFTKIEAPPSVQLYFEGIGPGFDAEEIVLFSGGLDSLAGAIQESIIDRKRVALVSHDSASKRSPMIAELAGDLAAAAPERAIRHIPVIATKSAQPVREYTQRTRSFLFAALATSVASMFGRDRIRFYENGVTSLNLPIAAQVVGGRATRTTHPLTIERLQRLLSLLLDRPFGVEAPFLWKTKTDIVRLISEQGLAKLVARSVSCSKVIEATTIHTHCGRCSQCIDRRFATIAAGLSDTEDPAEMYKVELFTGARTFGEDRTMIESFVRRAERLRSIHEIDFLVEYPEASRALLHVGLDSEEAGRRIFDLHRRHGEDVVIALAEAHKRFAAEFQRGTLPNSCLLVLTVPEQYRNLAPDRKESAGPTFRFDGERWRVWFAEEQAALKDSVGLHHLARLLSSPGHQIDSADLATTGGDGAVIAATAEVTDRETVAAVRGKIEALKEAREVAASEGVPDRVLEIDEEIAELEGYLASATGLGGKPRLEADEREKARQAATKALRRARRLIEKRHPPLGGHLRKYLKIGHACAYAPEPAVIWTTV